MSSSSQRSSENFNCLRRFHRIRKVQTVRCVSSIKRPACSTPMGSVLNRTSSRFSIILYWCARSFNWASGHELQRLSECASTKSLNGGSSV